MTTSQRLLILSFSNIAADARVLKQVQLLSKRYDVTTCGYGDCPDDMVTHIRVPDELTIDDRNRNDLVLRLYRRMYWNLPAIAFAQSVLSKTEQFDVILANDVDTVGLALSLRPKGGVHADIHEYAPRQNSEILIWRLFVSPYVRWMCRTFLTKASSITTVGRGVALEYRRVFGLEAGIVTNAAPYSNTIPTATGVPIRLVHSGAALRNRHLETLIAAVITSTADVTLDLYLMPNDPIYISELQTLAARDARVTICNPVPYSELIKTLNQYDLGVHIIPPTNFNNQWSLPNKFFDYVQARLGLLIGPSPEMANLLHEYNLGVVARGFDADDIRQNICTLRPGDVARWKNNSDAAAKILSAETQMGTWDNAIRALAIKAEAAA